MPPLILAKGPISQSLPTIESSITVLAFITTSFFMTELEIKHPGPIETPRPIVLFPSNTELTSINDPRPITMSPLTSSLEESAT